MEFRTKISIPNPGFSIDHTSKVMLFGSCFSENIGAKLSESKFQVDVNPFGILYNPMSVSAALKRIIERKAFTEEELVQHNGLYHSLMHHGSLSHSDKSVCLHTISNRFESAANTIQSADVLLITFGTAYIYKWKKTGEIAGNCHKLPSELFLRERMSVDEILKDWNQVIEKLIEINTNIKIVFTVSPIRHWKDGAHENQVSKSILHLSVNALQNSFTRNICYFPAYEIVLDELRDYRFYAEDMMHPSSVAIDYIWERFSETYFTENTQLVINEWTKIKQALRHRPINAETASYRSFLEQTLHKLLGFSAKHPYINCNDEINALRSLLKN